MEKTTKKFAGLFASDFWETLVFQASAQEPAVRHAVVALSAAHRYDSKYGPWMVPATYGFDAERFTLQQYNKAIKYLRTPGGNNKNSHRVALITCMIFVTLEYLRGQYQMGSAHLHYGIQLLSESSTQRPSPSRTIYPNILGPAEDFAHRAIIDSYARLTTQSAMFGYVPPDMCLMTRDPQTNALPYTFASMVEARQTLDDLLNRIHCLKRHTYSLKPSNQPEAIDPEMHLTRKNIMSDLTLWRKTHTATYTRQIPATRQYQFGSILLRVYHEMATIMASVVLSPSSEMAYDDQTPHFVAIVEGFFELWKFWTTTQIQNLDITELMKCPECRGNGFTVEGGFIPPVYYTALKCRVPRIRRQAIRTLRSAPHREGVWNGPLLADVLEVIIRIEEGDFYGSERFDIFVDGENGVTEGDLAVPKVPEERRVSDVKVVPPNEVAGDTLVTYKKIVCGEWVTFERKVEPGVLRGWKLHFEGPEVTIGGLWKGMSQ